MRTAAAQPKDRARSGAWRLAATCIVLVAFALQSYITQTHFHPESLAFNPAPAAHVAPQVSPKPPPGKDEAAVCPLCQAVASAGAFLAPGGPLVLPLAARAVLVSHAPVPAGRTAAPAGFAWRSRAPPRP